MWEIYDNSTNSTGSGGDEQLVDSDLVSFYYLNNQTEELDIFTRHRLIVGSGYRRKVLHAHRWYDKQILNAGDWIIAHSWNEKPQNLTIERKEVSQKEYDKMKMQETSMLEKFEITGDVQYYKSYSRQDIL